MTRGIEHILAVFIFVLAIMATPVHAATIAVTANAADVVDGTDGSCTLREAIQNVNDGADTKPDCAKSGAAYGTADTITLPAGTYTNALASTGELLNGDGSLDIRATVTITGAAQATTLIDGGAIDRVMTVAAGVTATLSGVTIQNGSVAGHGGGIYCEGALSLTDATVTANTLTDAFNYGAGISVSGGSLTLNRATISLNSANGLVSSGGIYLSGATGTITDSSITGDSGHGVAGIHSDNSTLALTGSTISGNTSANKAGVFASGGGSATITNSTISGNTMTGAALGSVTVGGGTTVTITNSTITGSNRYGIYVGGGTVVVSNSIVAENSNFDCDVGGGSHTSSGYNIDSDGTCGFGGVGDISGSGAVDLVPLADNGGSTQTHALATTSAALDAGDCDGGATTDDQRGTARPQGSACDIGAYETVQYAVNVTVSGTGSVADDNSLAGFDIACGATCADHVFSGESVVLVPTADAGWSFTGWSGDCSGTGNCSLAAIAAAKNVTATFTLNTYAITVNAGAGGTASCTPNPVDHGSSSTCTATPGGGYSFTGWSGDCSGATCTLSNVTGTRSVTASFALNTYTITVNAGAGGTASCTPNPVDHGSSSTCTATPDAGYSFTGWSGDCTGATCTLSNVTGTRSVTASFALNTYAITVNAGAGGTASCTPNPVDHGSSSTCTATPDGGYSFTGWGGDCSGTGNCTLSNVTGTRSVTAGFLADGTKTYTAPSATGSGNITASFTGGGTTCGYTLSQYIPLSGHAASPPAGSAPAGVSFLHGLFDFTTGGCTAGSTIALTITYPQVLPAGTAYWKYGPTPTDASYHWYQLPATVSGNTVTFTITDGGLGDDDLAANGAIVDQGGPGAGAAGIPTLSEWALLLLAGLIGLAGMGMVRPKINRG